MMALAASLTELVPLFLAVEEGRAPPVPLATSLTDTTMQLLDRASRLIKPANIGPIEEKWLPDDMLRHVFEFATGRRRMSQFGPGGAVVSWPVTWSASLFESRHPVRLTQLRLVCRSWARVASAMVSRVVIGRPVFDPVKLAATFPNVIEVRYSPTQRMNTQAMRVSRLLELLMRDRVAPLYVRIPYSGMPDTFSMHGAYLAGPTGHELLPARLHARAPFKVEPTDMYCIEPRASVELCNYAKVVAALTSRLPLCCGACWTCVVDLSDFAKSAKFNVPSVRLVMRTYGRGDPFHHYNFWKDVLSNRDYWECGELPKVTLCGDPGIMNAETLPRMTALANFIQLVGVDRVQIEAAKPKFSTEHWLKQYRVAANIS